MSRYFDDELTHSGVKGMKWRKHKYKMVKDKNGNPIYVYYTGPQKRAVENGKYYPKNEHDLPLNKLGFSQSGNKNEATGAGGNFQKPIYSLRPDRNTTGTAKAIPRKNRVKTDRLESKTVGASAKSETVKRGQVANNRKSAAILRKEAVKAQKKKKITNMIDKGKKVVEKFQSEVENEAPRIGKAVAGTFKYGTKYNLASRDASYEKDRSSKAKTARSKEHAARAKMEKDAQNKKLSTHLNRTKRALTDTFTPKKKKKR